MPKKRIVRIYLQADKEGQPKATYRELDNKLDQPCLWCRFKRWLAEPIVWPRIAD